MEKGRYFLMSNQSIILQPKYVGDFQCDGSKCNSKCCRNNWRINIDVDTIDYFKEQSKQSGIPYQTLINLYLADCVAQKKQLQMTWK